ncbi:uncharacterized protein RCC_10685 [Ramularia collo-cygni]|uniref:Protein kinase domain-containing protein n=1 Tax=Ramularia collo-cygni TaxID=112498 RepID=A0A2D3V6E4_9PEZI|nr:uncharacterized protein RCC_10685 [Ramularia collo-cygni]CZT24956.1 uncharacterized protein RCC_10685 [Ramularia collo-cygni]
MVVPTKWPAFRKRYIRQDRHDNYASALQEVSAGWAETKQIRDSGVPDWRRVAEVRMQARIDANIQRRNTERDRLDAAAQAEQDRLATAAQAEQHRLAEADQDNQELLGKTDENGQAADAIWRGGWPLFGGRTDNSIHVWVKLDAQQIVVDRRVLKDTVVPPTFWVDFTRWSGPDLRDFQSRQHMDYVVQNRLSMVPDGGHFVRASAYRNLPAQYIYRTIQEFCDGGDLSQVNARHPDGIPEPLIWRVIEQLARAAIVMEQGSLAGPVPGWQQIVHYDFKPDNVFLTSSRIPAAAYPDAKLGDFEMSLQTSPTDTLNPHILREISAADLSWGAPETRSSEARWMSEKVSGLEIGDLDGEQILSPANIWGIGVCAFELMNGDVRYVYYEDADAEGNGFNIVEYSGISLKQGDPFFLNWEETALETYSSHLVDIVRSCLWDQPRDRVTPIALLAAINGPIPPAEDDEDETVEDRRKAQGAQGDRDGMQVDEKWPVYVGFEDRYRMGFSYSDITTSMAETQDAG